MRRWIGTSASADVVECHFCTQESRLQSHKGKATVRDHLPVITGSPHHFLCPYCESWNIKDPSTREFVESVQSVHHSVTPATTALRNKRASRISETPFCHNCTTNQQLQVQLIAGYLPSDITQNEENELLSKLPRYRESLDARYPIVCSNCQGRVDDIIKEKNWKAKARTIGGWLQHSARLARNAASTTVQLQNDASNMPSHLRLWRVKGTCWKALYFTTALAPAVGRPIVDYTGILRHGSNSTNLSYLKKTPWHILLPFFTLLFSFWDPTYQDRLLRDGRLDVRGKKRWFTLQATCYLARLAIVCGLLESSHYAVQIRYAISLLHAIALFARRQIIWIQGPKRIKLLERSTRKGHTSGSRGNTPRRHSTVPSNERKADSSLNALSTTTSLDRPAFGQVSMGSTPPISRMYKRHGFSHEDEDLMDEDEDEDDDVAPMDWQPIEGDCYAGKADIPDVDMQGDSSGEKLDIKLKPAIFNPEDEWNLAAYGMKGLDSLFAKGVTLDDIRMDPVPTPAPKTKTMLRIISIILIVLVCCVTYVAYHIRLVTDYILHTAPAATKQWPFK